jgi:hypothetical protein
MAYMTPRTTMIVLHVNSLQDEYSQDTVCNLANYTMVATTEKFLTLDDLYKLTNHTEDNWVKNADITSRYPFPRSTSVGDIIIDLFDPFRITYYKVVSFGFERVDVTNTYSCDGCDGLDEL